MPPGRLILVGVGGAVGTAIRASTESLIPETDDGLPVAIIVINVLGALALGLVTGLAERPRIPEPRSELLTFGAGVGVLGGFTSYSTMAAAAALAVDRADAAPGIGVLFALIAVGVLVAGLGYRIAAPPSEGDGAARPAGDSTKGGST